jgi:phthiocerol/phenolphthiocerol synthesis type-I polyketide synthase E
LISLTKQIDMQQSDRKKDIAIVGMSGRFPQSENIQAFWNNLAAGRELVRFYTNEELAEKGIDKDLINNNNYIKCDAAVENAGSFDYAFFGYTLEEASIMDPQVRVMHEQVWAALDDAGYTKTIDKETIGLYLTASDNLNWRAHAMMNPSDKVTPFLAYRIANKDFISTMISYKLGLKGPAYYVDTACSGSLSAVHLACRALLLRECSIAVAGGVSISTHPAIGYVYKEDMIASKDGHCRAFDAQASGTIWGEGAAAVVLKRFEEAVIEGDHIYAVIRSTAVNNDGKRKVGYTAPSIEGQAECIKLAHKIANVSPASISYIEAHGTGTRLGDPIEIEALNKAFNYDTGHSCAIGSVKTNTGHLDAAAGITGLIKAALSLEHKMLVPSLHFSKPNPEINFKTGPFYVNSQLKKWEPKNGGLLRCGVSSFGIGGTNAHVVLEQAPAKTPAEDAMPFYPVLYSGKTIKSLNAYRQKLLSFLQQPAEHALADLSYTSCIVKTHFKYRGFSVGATVEDAATMLTQQDAASVPAKNSLKESAFMFPGQGTQYFGMAKELYLHEPYFRSVMDKGFAVLNELSGVDFREVIGYSDKQDDQSINNTLYTQPLLFLLEYALAQLLMRYGIKPSRMIGHSLGEYVAACISQVFSFEDGLKIVWQRAKLMNSLPTGAMLAVNADQQSVRPMLTEGLSIAVINTNDTCVVSGRSEEIDALTVQLNSLGISCTRLKTSHAFHSGMMDDILPAFEKLLCSVKLSAPQIPFVSNHTGKFITQQEAADPKYWVAHLRGTVLFSAGLQTLLDSGNDSTAFIEIGPGKTLSNFLKRHAACRMFSTVRTARENLHDYKQFLVTLGQLWQNGLTVDWNPLYQPGSRKKAPLPSYAFDQTNLPLKVRPFEKGTLIPKKPESPIQELEVIIPDEQIERPNLGTSYQPPENKIQQTLCNIWQSFMGYEQIGINDNFFELGGDSLRAMSLLSRIQKEFNVVVNLQDFYVNANIKDISREIEIALKLNNTKKPGVNLKTIKI